MFLVALGTGEPYYEGLFRSLNEQYAGKISVKIAYDNAVAHKVEAGSDIFLMPSRYEPCGLNQIYSLKYGTVPVVHATGGLDDTVSEWHAESGEGTGFKFPNYDANEFYGAIERALTLFRTDKKSWTTLMRNGMKQNYSWSGPAKEYAALYEEVARRRS